ncbi:DNA polymerase III subunit alpha [Candidatus Parcubacteria bacterium]|nr:DNA polymerase III subunit alpha [Candidatus Parcubacteria bacterium]
MHTHYSLLDGLSKIDELLDYVKELGMDSCAITDHGVLYGAVEFYQKAKKRGIKPIIGCEVYMAYGRMDQRRSNIDDKRYHLVLLVKNETGYKNLVKLVTKAHLEGFYYKPRIDDELLARHCDGLIAMTGCVQGRIPRYILSDKIDEAEKLALKYQNMFGQGNFYLELQCHPNLLKQKQANQGLIALSKKLNIPLVATNDCHYLRKEDNEAQDVLMMISTDTKSDNSDRKTMKFDDYSVKSPETMIADFKDTPSAIENTQKIMKQCNFDFKLGEIKLPYYQVPDNKQTDEYLRELCEQGLEKRFEKNHPNIQTIKERMNYELSVIHKMGFDSYFLIVQDFVNWAKQNRIVVGPGRGSAAGSIVSYLLNITDIDPIKYNLLFERFLNPSRVSMPDIDLDFTDWRRDEVINYIRQKYGEDKVAQIITFGTMAARAVIRDVGRALNYQYSYCDVLAKKIPFGFTLDQTLKKVNEFREVYESDEQATRLIDLAKKLEGVVRHASTHACGVVMSKEPLTDLVPLQHPTQNDDTIVTQYGMHAIEDLGLLKMDLLGLKNLTIIEDTLTRVYKVQNKSLNIENIPLDDEKVYEILQKGESTSIFQLECLAGDTKVSTTTIKKLYEQRNKKNLHSLYLDEGKIHKNKILDVVCSGKKELYTLVVENNWYIKATKNHYFLTESGWKTLGEIKIDEKILIKSKYDHLVYNICKTCGKQISGRREGKSNFCYKCSASFYKNPSKKEVREKIKASRIKFYQQGGKPWNLGLSKTNNKILENTGKKISKALKGRSLEELWGKERAVKFKKTHSAKMKGEGNPMFGKPSPHRKGGFREDLNHYVRSNWEADFARILKLHNLKYEYEPKSFELIKTNNEILHYTPDFYVKSNNTFYEIKGWLHDLDEQKMELFQKQYPQYNFVLISATKFAEFALKYKNLVKWECPRLPAKNRYKFIKVKKKIYSGKEETYDITMESPGNNFIANGFVVHNSDGMKRYLKQLKPTEFEDIIAMVSLYRPGPMAFIPEYIKGKENPDSIKYLNPKLEPILKSTYGIMIYQEQLMQIAQQFAGFSLAEADILRKAVGKKIKELLFQQKEKFIQGAVNQGASKEIAQKIWEWILPFASYGFNRSHGASYAMIAYRTAYLKVHYPVEFMAAVLTSEKNDVEKIAFLIDECNRMKIEVLPPDINESFRNFSVIPDVHKIRFGLLAIKNVGENVVEAIVEERKQGGEFSSIADFMERIPVNNLNKKSMESLIKAGAFDKFEERNKLLQNLERLLEWARETQRNKENGQKGLFESMAQDGGTNHNTPTLVNVSPIPEKEKLLWEKQLLGLYISGHPLESFKKVFAGVTVPLKYVCENSRITGKKVKVGGIISSIKKINTKTGRQMLFVKLEDQTSKIELVVFPTILEQSPIIFEENKIIMVDGRVDNRGGVPKIICQSVEEVIES